VCRIGTDRNAAVVAEVRGKLPIGSVATPQCRTASDSAATFRTLAHCLRTLKIPKSLRNLRNLKTRTRLELDAVLELLAQLGVTVIEAGVPAQLLVFFGITSAWQQLIGVSVVSS
jgi:hypothetical protein